MNLENQYYDVTPRIVPADTMQLIKIRGLFEHAMFRDDLEYEINYYATEHISSDGSESFCQGRKYLKPINGELQIQIYFCGEQEHLLNVGVKGNDDPTKTIYFRVYSLYRDLFIRRPFKGDFHMHSWYSDGKEAPGFIAANCRKIGFDFMAITDHKIYYPSIEAQNKFKSLELDMLICRGEEVQPTDNPVHMINFGGSESINKKIMSDKLTYASAVDKIKRGLAEIRSEEARHHCASCIWVFENIRECGGLGIFCHPYWLRRNGYYISDAVTAYMLERQPYDAFELLGGYNKQQSESNTLQLARYNDAREKGKNVPIVGVSDAHSCTNGELFGWYYTIVFSHLLEQQAIIDNIKSLYSVAVEHLPGEVVRVYGPFRLVKYAMFLLREVIPHHDELCYFEGEQMLRYIKGDGNSADMLSMMKGQTSKLYDRLWAN